MLCSGIEVVITGLTRNQFVGNHTWVRIPPAAPTQKFPPLFRFRLGAKTALWWEFFCLRAGFAALDSGPILRRILGLHLQGMSGGLFQRPPENCFPLLCSFLPNRTRWAGFGFGWGCVPAERRFWYLSAKSRPYEKVCFCFACITPEVRYAGCFGISGRPGPS